MDEITTKVVTFKGKDITLTGTKLQQKRQLQEYIIINGTMEDRRAFFSFDATTDEDEIYDKFRIWARVLIGRYIRTKDAPFHRELILNLIRSYRGQNYIVAAFRGSAKTTYAKLFLVFILLNDADHSKKFIKVLAKNLSNAKQVVTDVYNILIELQEMYPKVLEKSNDTKHEESMSTFTLSPGYGSIKLASGTVGMTQRGHLQDAYRPDWIWFDDIEDRESIGSFTITEGIIQKCDEAITGLALTGSYVVTANYISEEGSVQWFMNKQNIIKQIVPIRTETGEPAWDVYSNEDLVKLQQDALDWYGDYMCDPTRADSAFFERTRIDQDLTLAKQPHFESAGVKYWGTYLPHHAYGIGADTSEGVGKDACTLALFDLTHGDLVATYFNNNIPPDLFGHELMRVGREFGNCIIAPEANNTGHATLAAMRDYQNIYAQRVEGKKQLTVTQRLGWRTTRKTKPQMFFEFRTDYNDGKIHIYDKNVLREMRSFTSLDLSETQVGMVTRHFDLLIAVVIAWQMKKYSRIPLIEDETEEETPLYSAIGI